MREAMFDAATAGVNLLNPDCHLYQEIARIAAVMRSKEALRCGRMYFRQISVDGVHFGYPYGTAYTLAFPPAVRPRDPRSLQRRRILSKRPRCHRRLAPP